jgi:hypothetical protein
MYKSERRLLDERGCDDPGGGRALLLGCAETPENTRRSIQLGWRWPLGPDF